MLCWSAPYFGTVRILCLPLFLADLSGQCWRCNSYPRCKESRVRFSYLFLGSSLILTRTIYLSITPSRSGVALSSAKWNIERIKNTSLSVGFATPLGACFNLGTKCVAPPIIFVSSIPYFSTRMLSSMLLSDPATGPSQTIAIYSPQLRAAVDRQLPWLTTHLVSIFGWGRWNSFIASSGHKCGHTSSPVFCENTNLTWSSYGPKVSSLRVFQTCTTVPRCFSNVYIRANPNPGDLARYFSLQSVFLVFPHK